MRLPWNRLVLAWLAIAGPVLAQEQAQEKEKDAWNGIKVVTRYARPLRGEDKIVERGTRFRVYTVKKVEDERVLVSSGEVEGWFYPGDVVPLKDAIAFYTEEIRANPANTSALNWRGIIRRELGDLDGAIEDYTEAIRQGSDGPHPLNNRGLTRMAQKDYDKAIEDFDAAIRVDPRHAMSLSNRGMARRKKLDYPGALADLDESLRIEAESRSALNEKAWLLATCPDDAIRDGKEAVTNATRACELTAWKDPNLIDTLAAAYAELGFFEQAARYQQEAIDKAPSGSPSRKTFASRLNLYRKKKPYREP